ncbi:rRNA maturation RNase YbeY [Gammaproteobacteria bacterium]|jgi:probable rRNA maturation factor|nr:rRNA maturation RNase YbeY [Gammaproteobacteria bacterium]
MITIGLQTAANFPTAPSAELFQAWATAIDSMVEATSDVSLRIVDRDEMASLNQQYRNKEGTTNVLAFPCELPTELPADWQQLAAMPEESAAEIIFLGDIVICAPVVSAEAEQQGKSEISHWAHLTVHGILHLLGFDHYEEADAERMEDTETAILKKLGFENPYH